MPCCQLTDLQYQLATEVTALADALSLNRIAQGKHAQLRYAHGFGCLQLQNALKVCAVATNRGAQRAHIGTRGNWRLGTGGNKGRAPTRLEHRERACGNVAADGV